MTFLVSKTLRRLPTFVSSIFNEILPKFTFPLLEYQLIGQHQSIYNENKRTIPNSVFDNVIWRMAVPKSKVLSNKDENVEKGIHHTQQFLSILTTSLTKILIFMS
jgi:hypothetical protein